VAHSLDLIMTRHYRQIQTVAALAPLRDQWTADPARLAVTLDGIRTSVSGYDWIGFADAGGVVRAVSGASPLSPQADAGSQAWFRAGRFGVSAVPSDATAHERLQRAADEPPASVVISAPVRDGAGALLGVLAADLPAGWAEELEHGAAPMTPADQPLGPSAAAPPLDVAVISAQGEVLAPPPFGAMPLSPQAARQAAMLGPGLHRIVADGVETLTAIAASQGAREFSGAGWLVVVRIAAAQANAPSRDAVILCVVTGGAVAVLGAILALLLAGRLIRPLHRLCDEAERAACAPAATLAPRAVRAGWGNHETAAIARALRVLTRRNLDAERQMRRAAATAATVAARAAEEVTRLRRLVDVDPMTGTLNRRGLRKAVEAARAGVPCRSMGALVIDIDHFKQVNDAHGHLVGDAVIRRVAHTIGETVRQGDIVARFGGEEFVVVVSNTTEREIAVLAERIREAVRDTDATEGAPAAEVIAVTVSVGGALAMGDAVDIDDVLARADAALYLAKNAGRNRVRMWRPGFARVRLRQEPPRVVAGLEAAVADAD
jgi:diguanylate cyclase (GGDEF)-like protein